MPSLNYYLIKFVFLLTFSLNSDGSIGLSGHSQSFSINFCGSACYRSVGISDADECRHCFCGCLLKELFDKTNEFFKFICYEKEWNNKNENQGSDEELSDNGDRKRSKSLTNDYAYYSYPDYYDMYFEELDDKEDEHFVSATQNKLENTNNVHILSSSDKKPIKTKNEEEMR